MLAVATNINPMLHIVLYMSRQKDMRLAIISLLKCRSTLPVQKVTVTNIATTKVK
jgi:hypothetical protein